MTRINVDRTGIVELSRDPRLGDHTLVVAELCRDEAIRTAPILTGTYKRSIFAAKLAHGNGAFYGSSDRKAMIIEHGSKRTKAFHTLRNAARKHKLRVVGIARVSR